jgi:CDP-diacylglycerol--serine O-phosphatidyltransferase
MIKNNIAGLKKYLPNFLTFCNMTMGVTAIILAAYEYYLLASLFVMVGAVLDRYDGVIARKFDITSELGKEMDSLADIITFGVAPSIIALLFPLSELKFKYLGYIITIIFVACGWYRLSRFNVSHFNNAYTGLPITIAGFLLALSLVYQSKYNVYPYSTALIMLTFSYLMISHHKIKKI